MMSWGVKGKLLIHPWHAMVEWGLMDHEGEVEIDGLNINDNIEQDI